MLLYSMIERLADTLLTLILLLLLASRHQPWRIS